MRMHVRKTRRTAGGPTLQRTDGTPQIVSTPKCVRVRARPEPSRHDL